MLKQHDCRRSAGILVSPHNNPKDTYSPAVNHQPGAPSINHSLTHISPAPLPSQPGQHLMTYTFVSVPLRNVFHENPIWTHTHHILSAPHSIHRMTIHFFFHTPVTTKSSLTLLVWFVLLQTYVGLLFNLSFGQRQTHPQTPLYRHSWPLATFVWRPVQQNRKPWFPLCGFHEINHEAKAITGRNSVGKQGDKKLKY